MERFSAIEIVQDTVGNIIHGEFLKRQRCDHTNK